MSRNGEQFERMVSDTDTDGEMSLDGDIGKKRRYKVSDSQEEEKVCLKPVTKRDVICLVIGGAIISVTIILFIVLAIVLQPKGESPSTDPWEDVRLPDNIQPQLYTIQLDVDMDTSAVEGSVSILATVSTATDYIILHAKDMNIFQTTVTVGGDSYSVKSSFNYTDNDFYVIQLENYIDSGSSITIAMTFGYSLRKDLVGFYKSSYVNNEKETRYLATTQFEPTDARKAFPCFDEPAMKANFSISISHPSEYNAVSNMPVESTGTKRSGVTTTNFQTSYKMSTYLVAFVVSDFVCNDVDVVSGRINVRVCASPVVFNLTTYAQEVATNVIEYYETFFDVLYPLPKQDLFAIPDFAAGAMENWGLITYRETALLYDQHENPESSKQRVAVVIAHELAHQWFGNLVTMDWWDGLWLNEGFASYVEYIGADHKEPEWMMLDQFFVDTIQSAYAADGLNWSHPIIQEVSDPDQINSLFDSISYDKGASLIRMLMNFIGNTSFTDGLSDYLRSHKYGNAQTSQLWEALDKHKPSDIDVSVSKMMDTWTKQMGYPVVTIVSNGGKASVKQSHFLTNPLPDGEEMASDYVWTIPFDYIFQNSPSKLNKKLITEKTDNFDHTSADGFVKANVQQNGFYRVNYDIDNWNKIINHLMASHESAILSPVDRAGLIDDAFALSSGGLLNITVALELSQYLQNEKEYVPWAAALSSLYNLADRLSLTSVYGKYQKFMIMLLSDITSSLAFGATGLSHLKTLLRVQVTFAAWTFGNEDIISDSLDIFRQWMNGSTTIDPDLREVIYAAAVAKGGEDEWNFLWERYLSIDDPYEKSLCLFALGHTEELWILSRYLEYSLTKVRSQDTLRVIGEVSKNLYGRRLAWDFFRNNYLVLYNRYGGGSFSFSRVIRTLTHTFSSEYELQEVIDFFSEHPAGSAALAVEQSKEVIRGNIQWMENNLETVRNWLDQY